ncbi:bifunctional oligoribonuclease/PAP phosphatase NrnA [symbiont of Argiope bruennichi]|uniref:DHH family phosphoesterase n=1 Tax=symbiont of Argiope bruennichi TaxID=2810479 RepID=UPI003DA3C08C
MIFENHKLELFLKMLSNAKNIGIFRHENPDGDSLSAQFSFYHWLKINFSQKNFFCFVDDIYYDAFTFFLQENNKYNQKNCQKFDLAIIFDTNVLSRVYKNNLILKNDCKIIVIDHHLTNKYSLKNFDLSFINSNASSTCEILGHIFFQLEKNNHLKVSPTIAKFLFYGLVTDTNRFYYPQTSVWTFNLASYLLSKEINITDIYSYIYDRELNEIKLLALIQHKFKNIEKNIIYYFLEKKHYEKYQVSYNKAKNFSFILGNIKNIDCYIFASFDEKAKVYKISIRSKKYPINHIAEKFGGGGHALASGVKLKKKSDINKVLEEIKIYFASFKEDDQPELKSKN